jgi:hypothetical protein
MIEAVGGWAFVVFLCAVSFAAGCLSTMTQFWWKRTKHARQQMVKLIRVVVIAAAVLFITGSVLLTAAGVL